MLGYLFVGVVLLAQAPAASPAARAAPDSAATLSVAGACPRNDTRPWTQKPPALTRKSRRLKLNIVSVLGLLGVFVQRHNAHCTL